VLHQRNPTRVNSLQGESAAVVAQEQAQEPQPAGFSSELGLHCLLVSVARLQKGRFEVAAWLLVAEEQLHHQQLSDFHSCHGLSLLCLPVL
jgi:hypothetical protein